MSQRDKPRLALNNITAGVRERGDANRTREAGHLDEIQGVVANTLNLYRNWAVGFIDWLDVDRSSVSRRAPTLLQDQDPSCCNPSCNENWTPIPHEVEWHFLGSRQINACYATGALDVFAVYPLCARIGYSWSSPIEILFEKRHTTNRKE